MSGVLRRFWRWLTLADATGPFAALQLAEIRRQMPPLYALLVINMTAVALTHAQSSPLWLTVAVPGVLGSICLVRLFAWLKRRNTPVDPDSAVSQLRRIMVFGGSLATVFVGWGIMLGGYGSAYEQAHVAFFCSITTIACVLCLMHFPQAAVLVITGVTGLYVPVFVMSGNAVFIAIALNFALVSLVMFKVVLNGFKGFTRMVRAQERGRRLVEENATLAHTDSLTGLPNRRSFFARIDTAVTRCSPKARRFALGLLDLDRFKPVNDTYGHQIGDRLLAEASARLLAAAGEGVVIARLGGDEFGFLIERPALSDEEVVAVGQRLCEAMREPFRFEDVCLTLDACCGLAIFPEAAARSSDLYERADYALYSSKTTRRGTTTLFSAQHETRILSERAIEAALAGADLDAELDVFLQPIVDLVTGEIIAAEALARWQSPPLGTVPPARFVPIAERSGMIHAVTLALFGKALSRLAAFPPNVALSFNLSAQDVESSATMLGLLAKIRDSGLNPSRITFELTETALMRNFDTAGEAISLLRSLGARIALDDFGTGYSSLSYLHRLPLDRVKLDKSFLADVDTPSGSQLATAILGLCSNLGLECIVEGVETEVQRDLLAGIGYRRAQGYLFARPMPIGDFLALLPAEEDTAAALRA